MITEIKRNEVLLAVIVRNSFNSPGVHFFTPDECSLQLGYMHHPAGKIIQPHIHRHVERTIDHTHEVLVMQKGRLRVDFYGDDGSYYESRILLAGDVILLLSGGHGFHVLEEIEMFEIKQGPFVGHADKEHFAAVPVEEIRILP